uniref:methylated diphthine methylhydrolase n=1 Tax=Mesocestoides corti TaxID=53468 RepID=A0A5K3FTQ2_MESCO
LRPGGPICLRPNPTPHHTTVSPHFTTLHDTVLHHTTTTLPYDYTCSVESQTGVNPTHNYYLNVMTSAMIRVFCEVTSNVFQLHADCVEFSPCGEQALVGYYQLDETAKKRSGQIAKFQVVGNQAEKVCLLDTAGILDLSWMGSDFCLAAASSGELYTIISPKSQPLVISDVFAISESILLSSDCHGNMVVTSDECGIVYLVDPCKKKILDYWKGHDFEAWCVRLNRNDANLILSGGDDCMARVWDRRLGFAKPVISKRHEMGVCSISSVPGYCHFISTGCFDEKLRMWDLRGGGEILICHTSGGGVWRHKWSPSATKVLMASMHAGFAVASIDGQENIIENTTGFDTSLTYYRQSAKLAYGVDWRIDADGKEHFKALIATCSFYDNCVTFATYKEQIG